MKPKGRVATRLYLLSLGLKAWPSKRLERRRNRRLRIRYIAKNHQYIAMRIEWGHEDQETWVAWPSREAADRRARKNRTAAARACDTPHPCSCSGCGNPRRVGWEKSDRATWQERNHELRFKEELKDFNDRESLDEIYDDYWSRPWGLMDEWTDNHSDLTDDWDWDETDYEIMENYRNEDSRDRS